MKDINTIVRENSAFKNLEAMLDTHPNYRPTIFVDTRDKLEMADAYDEMMEKRGDERRAFRCGTPPKRTYASVAKEFREKAKRVMASCKKSDRSAHFTHRGCEIIALDKKGFRHEGDYIDYLDMNEVTGKRVKEIVDHELAYAERCGDTIHGFSLDGGIDYHESFTIAMKYPDDYEPMYDTYEVDFTLEEME
jgi:hypothetical protein